MHDRLVSRRIDALHQCFLVAKYCPQGKHTRAKKKKTKNEKNKKQQQQTNKTKTKYFLISVCLRS